MGELPKNTISVVDQHHTLLSKTIGDETIARNSKVHSYGKSFNGFAAKLLPHEAEELSKNEGVISVFRNEMLKLQTTRSWDFLGMPLNVKRNEQVESDTIIAMLDTGIWTDNPSFNDEGFGPPPKKWKGKCDSGQNFTRCNKQVIGARFFQVGQEGPYDEPPSPVDLEGHGTHTASTAAGIPVAGASLYGIAEGTARGGAPRARIASYKVCWGPGCQDADLLAGFDAAIADGADVISVSIGGRTRKFTEDSIAIGSFHAARRGILTVCAAGNDGPTLGLVENVAPWVLTVAASTTDRKLVTDVALGNGKKIPGVALNTYSPKRRLYPLTNGALARNSTIIPYANVSACDFGSLNETLIRGKIVYCQGAGGDNTVPFSGGAGTIMSDNYYFYLDVSRPTFGPATYISYDSGLYIDSYINSTRSPQAVIFKTKSVNVTDFYVAHFSSRGPQDLSSNLLKPDISAPGVDILAGYTKFTSLLESPSDHRFVNYTVFSGTSMATPHVSGAAAYVKTYHPSWSPAAIKSALMTTSTLFKVKPVEAELATGAGQLNPTQALHPGLVYDMDIIYYVSLLCKQGYTSDDIILLTGSKSYNCSKIPQAKGADGLNYPSIYYQVDDPESGFSEVYYREVTNVGFGKSTYKAEVNSPEGLSIEVNPNVLNFDRAYQKASFAVTLKGKLPPKVTYLSGSLVWDDGMHRVRSPVLVSYYNSSVF
ncbi:Subtilisin-like serine endopeptidase family protein [Striga hermonthica]|uniref:Subtilisin-like serine endopeptidase family protein n=1 Tax=Striga hermonthica TaxID=68872 RepID=A0A9N7N9P6_STRHE|nr:Subtilisin-like serine endopeptidase family protein [Striga hermonthica]